MKTIMIILLGTIGFVSYASMTINQGTDSEEANINNSESSGSSQYDSSKDSKYPNDPYVRDLPKAAQDAIMETGIRDIMLIAVVLQNGEIRLLQPDTVFRKKGRFPIVTSAITAITPISLVAFKKSHCIEWSDGTKGSGGAAEFDAWCTVRGLH